MTTRLLHRLADNPAVFRHVRQRFAEGQALGFFPVDRNGPTGEESCVFSQRDGVVAGFVTYYEVNDIKIWIDLVWVDPAHRRIGLAKAMLEEIRDEVIGFGFTRIELGTGIENTPMQALAASVGLVDRFTIMSGQLVMGL